MPAVSFTSSCVQCESLGEKCDGAPGRGSCTACRTSAKGGAKCSHNPGRPPNAFILFRLSYVRSLPTDAKARRQALSSKGAATAWKELSRKERLHWHEEAELKKEEHSRLYPEYSYTPTTKAMKAARHGNFGPARVVRKKGRRLDVEDDYERHIEQRHVSLSPSPSAPECHGLSPISLPVALDLLPMRTHTPSDSSPISAQKSFEMSPASVPGSLDSSPISTSLAYPERSPEPYQDVEVQWSPETYDPYWQQSHHVDDFYPHPFEESYVQQFDDAYSRPAAEAYTSPLEEVYASPLEPSYMDSQQEYYDVSPENFSSGPVLTNPAVASGNGWDYIYSPGPLLYTPGENEVYEEFVHSY